MHRNDTLKNSNLDEINKTTINAISVFSEILEDQGFMLDIQQNGIMGTRYKFKQVSILTGITEIDITSVSDTAPDGTNVIGIKIDNIRTSTKGIGIGAKLIAILSEVCNIFKLDLCLWSEDNKRLKRYYRKLGFKENHTNAIGETLFILKKYNYENVMEKFGKDAITESSKISTTIAITHKYFDQMLEKKKD